MTLRIEFSGESIFMNDFWRCECEFKYIRRKAEWIQCPKCKAVAEDNSDAELEDLLLSDGVLTEWEKHDLVNWIGKCMRSEMIPGDFIIDCGEWADGDTPDIREEY